MTTGAVPPAGGIAGELVLLANDSMRARRRPAAVAVLWLWQLAFGLLLAWPAVSLVGAFYGRHPRGDAPLWEPGGLPLFDLALHAQAALAPLVTHAFIILTFAVILGLLPTAALLVSIAFTTRSLRAPPMREAFARAYLALWPMLLLLVVTTAVQLTFALLGWWLGGRVDDLAYNRFGEARAEQLGWVAGGLMLLPACAAGVAEDVARAAIVRFRVSTLLAMRLAWNTFRRNPVGLCWSWLWRAAAGVVPLAFGSLVAERIGGEAGAALIALFAIHQVVALARVALRASWLARAMRAVDAAHRVLKHAAGSERASSPSLPSVSAP